MQYQNEEGIYVYYLRNNYDFGDAETTVIDHIRYKSLEHFFWLHNDKTIQREVGYSIYDIKCNHVVGHVYGRGYARKRYIYSDILCGITNCTKHDSRGPKFKVVCDENGNQYLPDVLVGMRRAWLNDRKASKDYRNRYNRTSNGRRKKAYGHYRHIRTFQERKLADAWDDVEFAPKTRSARTSKILPNPWDDILGHNDKSWKTQSKRKKQWKENEKCCI